MQLNKSYWGLIIVTLIILVPVFGRLDSMPIKLWDESRLAINAFEMYYEGDWLVTTFYRETDLWNTKPPLLIWIQVFFFNIVGVNELAMRLPSAIAAAATCYMLFWFFARKIQEPVWGIVAIVILLSCGGYVNEHVIRTGDYDALLILFTTCYCLFFYLYIEEGQKRKNLYLFFACLTLAAMTKGVAAAGIFLPALFIYALYRKKVRHILTSSHTYIGIAAFLAVVGGFYWIREMAEPGYLKAVWYNDFSGRYLKTDMDNGNDIWYYTRIMTVRNFNYWYMLIPCGIITGLASKSEHVKRISLLSTILALSHLIIISKSQTKNGWYDACEYPFWSIIVGNFIYTVFTFLSDRAQGLLRYNVIPYTFLFLILVNPYVKTSQAALSPAIPDHERENDKITGYLQRVMKDKVQLPANCYIVYDGYEANMYWYHKVLNYMKKPFKVTRYFSLEPGQNVITYQEFAKNYIKEHYHSYELETHDGVIIHHIDSINRNNPPKPM